MRRTQRIATVCVAIAGLVGLAACSSDPTVEAPPTQATTDAAPPATTAAPSDTPGGTESTPGDTGSAVNEWFDQALYDTQFAQRTATFLGDPAQPYLQYIDGPMADTSSFASDGAKKACFANASISNPWRQTGWITMNVQLDVLQQAGIISSMETRDAGDSDDTQIADIDYFIAEGNCDVFIISPNSTAAMTPAVERACATGKPVIIFDRGVQTDCPVTFIHPIGGFAWGIDTAQFLIDNLEAGDKVVALRILPGVDVLEHRWAAAQVLFAEAGIEVVEHFTGADPADIKQFITDELAKGDVDGVWMDAGDGGVAAIEAFEDAGVDYPVMTGEDEMSFLRKWKETGLTGLAPVYSNFQWRTPLLAVEKIFKGEEIPVEWVLPQVPITAAELDSYLTANEGMPNGHYAKFGGEDLPGFPEIWQQRQIP
jgi:ribose transport system substrate-binding protein